MSEWTFRLAEEKDAPMVAEWVKAGLANGLIDPNDVQAGLKKNNPTVLGFIAERDGKPIVFCPAYCQLAVAHLAFLPDSRAAEKMSALRTMLDGLMAFSVSMGLREIVTLTKSGYPIAEFARKRLGFVADPRELFKLDINMKLKRNPPPAD
jgi:hypothetical protein